MRGIVFAIDMQIDRQAGRHAALISQLIEAFFFYLFAPCFVANAGEPHKVLKLMLPVEVGTGSRLTGIVLGRRDAVSL